MKKLISTLWMTLFLLSTCAAAAYADVLIPTVTETRSPVLPIVLIGVAVIVAAVVIWRVRKKK